MKISSIIFAFFAFGNLLGQNVYTSQLTQHFPSTEMERIDRVITFDDDRITIKSVTKDDKVKIQTLRIKGKVLNFDDEDTYVVYECSSRSGRSPITVMIRKNKPDHITLMEPSLTNRNELVEVKMLLDK